MWWRFWKHKLVRMWNLWYFFFKAPHHIRSCMKISKISYSRLVVGLWSFKNLLHCALTTFWKWKWRWREMKMFRNKFSVSRDDDSFFTKLYSSSIHILFMDDSRSGVFWVFPIRQFFVQLNWLSVSC